MMQKAEYLWNRPFDRQQHVEHIVLNIHTYVSSIRISSVSPRFGYDNSRSPA